MTMTAVVAMVMTVMVVMVGVVMTVVRTMVARVGGVITGRGRVTIPVAVTVTVTIGHRSGGKDLLAVVVFISARGAFSEAEAHLSSLPDWVSVCVLCVCVCVCVCDCWRDRDMFRIWRIAERKEYLV